MSDTHTMQLLFQDLQPIQKRHVQNILLQMLPCGTLPERVAEVLEGVNPPFTIYLRLPMFATTNALMYTISYFL